MGFEPSSQSVTQCHVFTPLQRGKRNRNIRMQCAHRVPSCDRPGGGSCLWRLNLPDRVADVKRIVAKLSIFVITPGARFYATTPQTYRNAETHRSVPR
jgi:hypothetical protein